MLSQLMTLSDVFHGKIENKKNGVIMILLITPHSSSLLLIFHNRYILEDYPG